MADSISYEDILSKFADSKLDTKEFLNLLFTMDENGIDYLQSLRKEFKEKYVLNTYKKASNFYDKVAQKITPEQSKQTLEEILDPFGIKELNKEYKEKIKKIYSEKLKQIDANLTLSEDSKPPINDSKIQNVLPDNVKNSIQEQQTFDPKPIKVTLSQQSLEDVENLLHENLNLKNLRLAKEKEETPQEMPNWLTQLGTLLLGGGVLGMIVSKFWDSHIKPWLEKKVGISLDVFEKFKGTLDGLSKFFTLGGLKLTGGWLFNLTGRVFTTIGDLIEGGLKTIFSMGFGDDTVKAGAKIAPGMFRTLFPKIAGGLFKGMGTVAFKAIPVIGSLISFYFAYDRFQKGEWVTGIVDLVGGLTNLLAFTPLAPLAMPLSIGASALNAFLDFKSGDMQTPEEKNKANLSILKNIGLKLYDFIKETPLIGGVISSIEGFAQWAMGITSGDTGAVKEGLLKMSKFPLLGVFPSIMLSLLDASTNENNDFSGFDFGKFIKSLRQDTLKTVLSWFPTWFGIRHKLADFMGITLDGEYKDEAALIVPDNSKTNEQIKTAAPYTSDLMKRHANPTEIKNLQFQIDADQKELDELIKKERESRLPSKELLEDITKKTNTIKERKRVLESLKLTQEQMEKEQNGKKNENEKQMEEKTKDIFVKRSSFYPSQTMSFDEGRQSYKDFATTYKNDYQMLASNQSSILLDNKTKTANILHPDDNILAYKKDGVFDKALQDLTNLVSSINKGILYTLPETLQNISTTSPSVIMNNNTSNNSNNAGGVLTGTRDSIYEFRIMNKRGVEIA